MKRLKSPLLMGKGFHPTSTAYIPTRFLQVIDTWSVNCTILLNVSHEQFLMESDAVASFISPGFFSYPCLCLLKVCCCAWVLYIDKSSLLPYSFLFFPSFSLCHSPHYFLSLSLFLLPFIICLPLPPIFLRHPPSCLSALNLRLSFPLSPDFSLSPPRFLSLVSFFLVLSLLPPSLSLSLIMTPISLSLLHDLLFSSPLLSIPLFST